MSRTAAVIEPVIRDSELLLFITSSSQRWQIYLPCGPRVWRGQRARVRSPGRGWRVFGNIGAGAFRRSGLVKPQMVPLSARQQLVALDGDISTEPQPAAPSTEN